MTKHTRSATPPLPPGGGVPKQRSFPCLTCDEVLAEVTARCAPFTAERFGAGAHNIILLPEAEEAMRHMTRLGKRRAVSAYEQIMEGMGHVFRDAEGRVTILISHVLYLYAVSRGPTHATLNGGGRGDMLDRLEAERGILNALEQAYNIDEDGYTLDPGLAYGPSEVVAYCHTHPDLGAWFSSPDYASSKATATFPAAILCCDPIRQEFAGYVGKGRSGGNARVTVLRYARTDAVEGGGDTVAELGALCNRLLQDRRAKGRFRSYRGLGGGLHVKFSLRRPVGR